MSQIRTVYVCPNAGPSHHVEDKTTLQPNNRFCLCSCFNKWHKSVCWLTIQQYAGAYELSIRRAPEAKFNVEHVRGSTTGVFRVFFTLILIFVECLWSAVKSINAFLLFWGVFGKRSFLPFRKCCWNDVHMYVYYLIGPATESLNRNYSTYNSW